MDSELIFDRDGVLSRVSNDTALLSELLRLFFGDYENMLENICAAIASGDAKRLGSESHSIKSALGNLGANRAYGTAFALEKLAASGSVTGAQQLVENLRAEIAAFRKAVAEFV